MEIGLIGLGVMGSNLAHNILQNFTLSIYNRTSQKTIDFCSKTNAKSCLSLPDFIASLKRPRVILLLVQSGPVVDNILKDLSFLINEDDVVVDLGNSYYKDTIRRCNEYSNRIMFVGCGISGGEYGARHGPSLMPGGNYNAWHILQPFLERIAAKHEERVCCEWIGSDGAGHFVKMVHNGIEYGIMALISEVVDILKEMGMGNLDMSNLFKEFNVKEKSYLYEITSKVLKKKDKEFKEELKKESDKLNSDNKEELNKEEETNDLLNEPNNKKESDSLYLIDLVSDKAENKGTGLWTVKAAMDVQYQAKIMADAIYARIISSEKEKRKKFFFNTKKDTNEKKIINNINEDNLKEYNKINNNSVKKININNDKVKKKDIETKRKNDSISIGEIKEALDLCVFLSYLQGIDLIKKTSERYDWKINLKNVCLVWKNGCIIRSSVLNTIEEIVMEDDFENSEKFVSLYKKCIDSLRSVVIDSLKKELPVLVMNGCLNYLDALKKEKGNGNIIQALRDYFGAHTVLLDGEDEYRHIEWDSSN